MTRPATGRTLSCCKGGSYNRHAFDCQQPLYKGEPPLPGHPLCPCWREGGTPCWRAHGQTRDKATRASSAGAERLAGYGDALDNDKDIAA